VEATKAYRRHKGPLMVPSGPAGVAIRQTSSISAIRLRRTGAAGRDWVSAVSGSAAYRRDTRRDGEEASSGLDPHSQSAAAECSERGIIRVNVFFE
jgi:hypothetical protein